MSVIVAFSLVTSVLLASSVPSGAIDDRDTALVECLFGETASDGSVQPNKKIAVLFPSKITNGKIKTLETYDPHSFLRNVALNTAKVDESRFAFIGASKKPRPFLVIFRDKLDKHGSYQSSISYLDNDKNWLGYCFIFTGSDGVDRIGQVRRLSAEGKYK